MSKPQYGPQPGASVDLKSWIQTSAAGLAVAAAFLALNWWVVGIKIEAELSEVVSDLRAANEENTSDALSSFSEEAKVLISAERETLLSGVQEQIAPYIQVAETANSEAAGLAEDVGRIRGFLESELQPLLSSGPWMYRDAPNLGGPIDTLYSEDHFYSGTFEEGKMSAAGGKGYPGQLGPSLVIPVPPNTDLEALQEFLQQYRD